MWCCLEMECITKSFFHLLKGLLLCGNAQIIRVQETPCVGMNRLIICIYVEQQRGKDAALWKAILLSALSAAFADELQKKPVCLITCPGSVLSVY